MAWLFWSCMEEPEECWSRWCLLGPRIVKGPVWLGSCGLQWSRRGCGRSTPTSCQPMPCYRNLLGTTQFLPRIPIPSQDPQDFGDMRLLSKKPRV